MTHRARFHRISFAAAVASAVAAAPRVAAADNTKAQCIEANTKSQELRREGKLAEAREQLRKCGEPACPRLVRDDCTKRLDELEKAQPTMVFDVKDARGADVIDVRVSVDGRLLVDHLDGNPVKVDPGAHAFSFEAPGQPPVVDQVLVREGETARHESVVIATLNKPAAAAGASAASHDVTSPSAGPDTPASRGLGTQRLVGLVVGGVGVAGLAAGTIFWQLGSSAWNSAKQACGGNPGACTDVSSGTSYRSTATSDATVSTLTFIVGGALLAVGGVLFLTGAPHERTPAASLVVAPSVGPRSAGLVLSGGFE
jgi:hypothetical protein